MGKCPYSTTHECVAYLEGFVHGTALERGDKHCIDDLRADLAATDDTGGMPKMTEQLIARLLEAKQSGIDAYYDACVNVVSGYPEQVVRQLEAAADHAKKSDFASANHCLGRASRLLDRIQEDDDAEDS